MSEVKLGERLLTTREAAEILGVGPTTVKRWCDEGKLPAIKTAGGHRRYRETDVLAMRSRGEPSDGLTARLPSMSRAEIDELDVGVVKVDDDGRILVYNRAESLFSGLTPREVEGRNFFTEVAPCMNNRIVYQRFREGVLRNQLDVSVEYTFSVVMPPTNVLIHMYRDPGSSSNWVIITAEDGSRHVR